MGKKIGVLLLIISFSMIGLGAYMYYFNPKKIMLEALASQVQNFKNVETKEEKTKISTKASLVFTESGNSMTANLTGDAYIDNIASKLYVNYVAKLDNETLASPEVYLEENKLYFRVKEYLDKLFYIKLNESDLDSKITEVEINEFITVLKDSIVNNVEENSFSNTKETITINKNSFKTSKYTLSLKAIELYNVCNEILTEVKTNSKLSNIRNIIFTDIDEATYSSELKKVIIGDKSEDRVLFDYSIYLLEKNEIIKHEIIYETLNEKEKTINNKITLAYYEKKENVCDYEFIIQSDNKNILEFTFDSGVDVDNISFSYDQIIGQGKLTKSDKNQTLKIDLFNSQDKNNVIATLNYKTEEIKENSEYKNTIDFNFKVGLSSFNLNIENNIYKNQDIPKFDTSKAEEFKLDSISNNSNILTS